MVMLTFLFLIGNTFFEQIWSKKSKLSAQAEIWHLDQFKYAELNGDAHFFRFRLVITFQGKFGSKNQNCQSNLQYAEYAEFTGAEFKYAESNGGVHFSVYDCKYPFWSNGVQKSKIFSLN